MDKALAMVFGGEEVLAADSSESDFYDLGLRCPCCRELVMYVKGYKKVVREREIEIAPCFRHFKEPDSITSTECELRVRQLSNNFWEKIKSKNKWQRRRIFQKYLWIIFCENTPTLKNINKKQIERLMEKRFLFLEGSNRYHKEKNLLDLYQNNFLKLLKEENHMWTEGLHATVEQYFNLPLENVGMEGMSDVFFNFREKIGMRRKSRAYQQLHESVCLEVIDFMITDSGKDFFQKIFVFLFVMTNGHMLDDNGSQSDLPRNAPHYIKVLQGVLKMLNLQVAGIHWGNEIGNRLNLKKASPFIADNMSN
jgi:hypothetical protein